MFLLITFRYDLHFTDSDVNRSNDSGTVNVTFLAITLRTCLRSVGKTSRRNEKPIWEMRSVLLWLFCFYFVSYCFVWGVAIKPSQFGACSLAFNDTRRCFVDPTFSRVNLCFLTHPSNFSSSSFFLCVVFMVSLIACSQTTWWKILTERSGSAKSPISCRLSTASLQVTFRFEFVRSTYSPTHPSILPPTHPSIHPSIHPPNPLHLSMTKYAKFSIPTYQLLNVVLRLFRILWKYFLCSCGRIWNKNFVLVNNLVTLLLEMLIWL